MIMQASRLHHVSEVLQGIQCAAARSKPRLSCRLASPDCHLEDLMLSRDP